MSADPAGWAGFASDLGVIRDDGEAVEIALSSGRKHVVEVLERDGVWELSGLVATADDLAAGPTPVEVWRHNAHRTLTSLVVDSDGDVWVTALAPVPGLTTEEFCWLAREVAAEADRLEFRLTGRDDW